MTTIAYAAEIKTIASDRRVTLNYHQIHWIDSPKIIKKGDFILAFSGDLYGITKFKNHLTEVDHFDDKYRLVEFFNDNVDDSVEFMAIDTKNPFEIILLATEPNGGDPGGIFLDISERGIHALGSGYAYALGAMSAGMTPEEAIEIASMFDNKTGGGIDVIRFE